MFFISLALTHVQDVFLIRIFLGSVACCEMFGTGPGHHATRRLTDAVLNGKPKGHLGSEKLTWLKIFNLSG